MGPSSGHLTSVGGGVQPDRFRWVVKGKPSFWTVGAVSEGRRRPARRRGWSAPGGVGGDLRTPKARVSVTGWMAFVTDSSGKVEEVNIFAIFG